MHDLLHTGANMGVDRYLLGTMTMIVTPSQWIDVLQITDII